MLTNNNDEIFLMLVLLNYFKNFKEETFLESFAYNIFKINIMSKNKGRLLESDLFTSGKLFPP